MEQVYKEIDLILDNSNYLYVSKKLIEVYYLIGKLLSNKNYNEVHKTEQILREKYGLTVGFSRRNILNMIKFYEIYQNYNIDDLVNISWNKHLLIMKQNNHEEYIKLCNKYNISKNDLEKIIKKGFDEKYISKNIIEDDAMTNEFISLKKHSQFQ